MTQKFYVVKMEQNPVLLSTISYDGETYHYKPYNLSTCKYPRLTKEVKSKTPPHLLERRTYSSGRPDIKELLNKMGLDKYDLWKMVEISEGRVATDNVLFLTEKGLGKYKINRNSRGFPFSEIKIKKPKMMRTSLDKNYKRYRSQKARIVKRAALSKEG